MSEFDVNTFMDGVELLPDELDQIRAVAREVSIIRNPNGHYREIVRHPRFQAWCAKHAATISKISNEGSIGALLDD
jgi:hypothetical protein